MNRISRTSPTWQDDISYEEAILSEFLRKREAGLLLTQQVAAKQKYHTAAVSLPLPHSDQYLRYGDTIMMANLETEGFVSIDLDDVTQHVPLRKLGITTSVTAMSPQQRNCWRILPPVKEVKIGCAELPTPTVGDVVTYGQLFHIQLYAVSAAEERDLYFLHSELKSTTSFSRCTKQQEVAAIKVSTPNRDVLKGVAASLLWSFAYTNASVRFEMEGQPVCVNTLPVLLVHHMTGNFLSSTRDTYNNDFGIEYEVKCCRPTNRITKEGKKQNLFVIVTAQTNNKEEEEEEEEGTV